MKKGHSRTNPDGNVLLAHIILVAMMCMQPENKLACVGFH